MFYFLWVVIGQPYCLLHNVISASSTIELYHQLCNQLTNQNDILLTSLGDLRGRILQVLIMLSETLPKDTLQEPQLTGTTLGQNNITKKQIYVYVRHLNLCRTKIYVIMCNFVKRFSFSELPVHNQSWFGTKYKICGHVR